VVAHLRGRGPGWRTRVNEALVKLIDEGALWAEGLAIIGDGV
jgi:hypothetical protein